MKNQIEALKRELNQLKKTNENLGYIIHRDNKIIPAMVYAVEQLLSSYPDDYHAKEALQKLKILADERNNILNQPEYNDTIVCQTGNIGIDTIINYMYQKAKKLHILLEFIDNVDLTYLNPNMEKDICTLIADTTDNAIIATKHAGNSNIRLQLDIAPGKTSILIYDSGIPFTREVIKNMGYVRYTTHKDNGGNGFGMMTIFDILERYNASLCIDETIEGSPYTKYISITFDEQYQITHNGELVR